MKFFVVVHFQHDGMPLLPVGLPIFVLILICLMQLNIVLFSSDVGKPEALRTHRLEGAGLR